PMRIPKRLVAAGIGCLLLAVVPGAVMARQDDPSLDGLFQRLKSVDDPVASKALQDAIWQAWIYSPEREEMQLMLQGIQAMQEQREQDALAIFTELCR